MQRKLRVGVIFGGKSAEHEISLLSAKSVIVALDPGNYEIVSIGIDHKGQWRVMDDPLILLNEEDPRSINLETKGRLIAVVPGASDKQMVVVSSGEQLDHIDVFFPVLHGPMGEDGAAQGLLKTVDAPFVGAGVLGSAVGMDKAIMKSLLRDAAIPTPKFVVLQNGADKAELKSAAETLGYPCFVKPANLGSSVGINKAQNEQELESAVKEALTYDRKVIIEEFIQGREIECSVLGDEDAAASLPGEILTHHDFYSYEAKYLDEDGAGLAIPADLPQEIMHEIQKLAVETFKVLNCHGMARVDFFLRGGSEILVNEINTIPGFTKISMFPKLWEISGLPLPKLVENLIELAIDRFKKEKSLKSTFD